MTADGIDYPQGWGICRYDEGDLWKLADYPAWQVSRIPGDDDKSKPGENCTNTITPGTPLLETIIHYARIGGTA